MGSVRVAEMRLVGELYARIHANFRDQSKDKSTSHPHKAYNFDHGGMRASEKATVNNCFHRAWRWQGEWSWEKKSAAKSKAEEQRYSWSFPWSRSTSWDALRAPHAASSQKVTLAKNFFWPSPQFRASGRRRCQGRPEGCACGPLMDDAGLNLLFTLQVAR